MARNFSLLILFSTSALCQSQYVPSWPDIPDCHRNATELIVTKGYPLEIHKVHTEDRYIVTMFRIPHGRDEDHASKKTPKPAVMLQHGLLDSASTWVINEPNESLGFMLADLGYDVWLGNSRGNEYSVGHETLDTGSDAYWDFSFDDMGKYDVPACVDYILAKTGLKQIGYVGHSQGTMVGFIGLSTLGEEFQKKIHSWHMLGPVTYAAHQSSLVLKALVAFDVGEMVEMLGFRKFMVANPLLKLLGGHVCEIAPKICENFLLTVTGWNPGPGHNMNATRTGVYFYNTPGGTSVKNMIHWVQYVKKELWRRYDYGSAKKNREVYGPDFSEPPMYYHANIANSKIHLYSGTQDALANPQDLLHLMSEIPDDQIASLHNEDTYSHLDFLWGINAKDRIYPLIIERLNNEVRESHELESLHAYANNTMALETIIV